MPHFLPKFKSGIVHIGILVLIVFGLVATTAIISGASSGLTYDQKKYLSIPGVARSIGNINACQIIPSQFWNSLGKGTCQNPNLFREGPYVWDTDMVSLHAGRITLIFGGHQRYYLIPGVRQATEVTIKSNKISENVVNLEAEWREQGNPLKITLLFTKNGDSWTMDAKILASFKSVVYKNSRVHEIREYGPAEYHFPNMAQGKIGEPFSSQNLHRSANANNLGTTELIPAYKGAQLQFTRGVEILPFKNPAGGSTPPNPGTTTDKVSPCAPVGDVNSDGKVTDADAQDILKYIAGERFKFERRNADVNNNRVITAIDAQLIKRFVAGQISDFQACHRSSDDGNDD